MLRWADGILLGINIIAWNCQYFTSNKNYNS
jgi:hypothetical protein